jgi:hypothetical protein
LVPSIGDLRAFAAVNEAWRVEGAPSDEEFSWLKTAVARQARDPT